MKKEFQMIEDCKTDNLNRKLCEWISNHENVTIDKIYLNKFRRFENMERYLIFYSVD